MTSRIPTDMVADRTSKAKLSDTLGSMQTSINTNTSSLADMATKMGWIDVTKAPYNIKGNGTYETTSLQNAFNDGAGKTIYVPDNLTITVGTTINLPSNATLIFGANSKILAGSTFSGSPILGNNDYTNLFTSVNPSQAVNVGDTVVYLPNVTGITVGMILKITVSKTVAANQYNVGELLRIKSVDTTAKTVTLKRPMRNAYTTSSLVDIVQPSKNIKLIDVVVDTGDVTKNLNAIRFSHVQNCYIQRAKVLTGGLNGIELDTCFDSKVEDSYIEGYNDAPTVTGRRGYGVALTGLNLLGRRNTITGCKHAMTSADRVYITDHITFEDNYAYDFSDAWAFDFHGNVFNGKMINNTVENAWGGIGIRCPRGKAINNTLKNTGKPFTLQEYGMVDAVIKDNIVDGYSDNGVMIYGAYSTLSNVKIQHNKFYNQSAGTFIVETGYDTTVNGDGLWIEDNIFDGFVASTAVIHAYQIGKVKIKGNHVNNAVDMASFVRIRPKTLSKYDFEISGNRVTGTNFTNYLLDVWNEGGVSDIFNIFDNKWNITSSTSKSYYNNIIDGTPLMQIKTVRNDYRKDKNIFYTPETKDSCRYRNSAGISIVSGTLTAVNIDTSLYDSNSMHDTTNTTRINVKKAGVYVVTCGVAWQGNATGRRELEVRRNGTDVVVRGDLAPNTDTFYQEVTGMYSFSVGDYIEFFVTQTSGSALNIFSDTTNKHPFIAVTQLTTA